MPCYSDKLKLRTCFVGSVNTSNVVKSMSWTQIANLQPKRTLKRTTKHRKCTHSTSALLKAETGCSRTVDTFLLYHMRIDNIIRCRLHIPATWIRGRGCRRPPMKWTLCGTANICHFKPQLCVEISQPNSNHMTLIYISSCDITVQLRGVYSRGEIDQYKTRGSRRTRSWVRTLHNGDLGAVSHHPNPSQCSCRPGTNTQWRPG